MQNKYEFKSFFNLPTDLQVVIARQLPTRVLYNYALASKQSWSLFAPILKNTHLFLQKVIESDHKSVKEMLAKDVELIVVRGLVKDCSGRIFEHVSGFAYALWAKDKLMWTLMLDCLSQSEKKSTIVMQLISQYRQVKEIGVTYNLSGKQVTEHHFDFENTIIKELQNQDNLLDDPDVTWSDGERQLNKGVGDAKKLLPMHVVHEYSSKRSFDPLLDLTKRLASKPSKKFYDGETKVYKNWFSPKAKLGGDFALVTRPAQGRRGVVIDRECVSTDLAAMKTLWAVRTQDVIDLEAQLEELASANTQPKAHS